MSKRKPATRKKKQAKEPVEAAAAAPEPEAREGQGTVIAASGPIPQAERALKAFELRYGEGLSYTETRNKLMEHFGVARCTAEEDLVKARDIASAGIREAMPHLSGELALRYLRNMDKAERAGKFEAVASLGGKLQRLLGIEAPRKVKHDHSGAVKFTSAGQRGRAQELLEKMRRLAAERAKPVDVEVVPPEPPADAN